MRADYVAVQTGVGIHPPPVKPGGVIPAFAMTGMERVQIDALNGEVNACASGLPVPA